MNFLIRIIDLIEARIVLKGTEEPAGSRAALMTLVRNAKDLGKTITARRKQKGLTQTDLAELAGTSVRLVSELERGVRAANVAKVLLICARLGLDVEIIPREERR